MNDEKPPSGEKIELGDDATVKGDVFTGGKHQTVGDISDISGGQVTIVGGDLVTTSPEQLELQKEQLALQKEQVDLQRQQLDLLLQNQRVSEGLEALGEMAKRFPAVREAMSEFRADFQSACSQVEVLANYKELHDLLHILQFDAYNVMVKAVARLPDDETAQDDLFDHVLTLEETLRKLRDVAGRASVSKADIEWVQEAAEAYNELKSGTEQAALPSLKKGLWRLNRILTIQPARINTRLTDAARGLRLPNLVNALTRISNQLTDIKLETTQVEQLRGGCEALDCLSKALLILTEDHDHWQLLDVELRRIESMIGQDLVELEMSWPDVQEQVTPLLQGEPADWAENLNVEINAVNEGLATNNPVKTKRAFRNFRSRVSNRFFQVDSELKKLCSELRPVGAPLASVLRIIE